MNGVRFVFGDYFVKFTNDVIQKLSVGAALFCSVSAYAGQQTGWSVGAGAAYSPEIYKETSSDVSALPLVSYAGEHFYWRGLELGYALNSKGAAQNLLFHLKYDMEYFDPGDSDNKDIKKLNKRDGTVLGGVTYQYGLALGTFGLKGAIDIADKHDGWLGEVSWSFPIFNGRWGLTPSGGYTYLSEDFNQHLYGVTATESATTGGAISEFNPKGEGQYFVSLSAFYMLTDSFMVNSVVKYTNLQGDVENSPLLGRTTYTTAMVNFIYKF